MQLEQSFLAPGPLDVRSSSHGRCVINVRRRLTLIILAGAISGPFILYPATTAYASSPNILSVSPSSAANTVSNQTLTISGTGFQSGASVALQKTGQSDIPGANVSVGGVIPGTQITTSVDLTAAAPGSWNVRVTNSDHGTDVCSGCLTITAAAPTVTSTAPSSRGQNSSAQNVIITGTNFWHGATASFSGTGITVNSTTWNSPTQVTANVTIASGAATGGRAVTVKNTDNQAATCASPCFTVNPAPAPTSTSPSTAANSGIASPITISGSNFVSGATVKLTKSGQSDIPGTAVNFVSSATLTASFDLTNAAPGSWTLVVTNPDAGVGTCACFTVSGQQPVISQLKPDSAGVGATNKPIEIDGTGFAMGATVTFSDADITVGTPQFVSSTKLIVPISIPANAAQTTSNVTVTNTNLLSGSCSDCFTVTTAPSVNSASPASGGRGATGYTITVLGNGFDSGATVTFGNIGIHPGATTVVNGSHLTVPVSIDADAATGPGDVTVTNSDDQADTCFGCFTVNAAPTATSVAPGSAVQGDSNVNVTINGSGFVDGPALRVDFGPDITTSNVVVVTSSSIALKISLGLNAAPGPRDVTVTNGDGGTATCGECFTVNLKPKIDSVSPAIGQGGTADVTISGHDFEEGATVSFSDTGITVNGTPVVDTGSDPETITANVSVARATTPGTRDVIVTNPTGGIGTCTHCFTVDAAPTVTNASPNSASNTGSVSGIVISGSGFANGATVQLVNGDQTIDGTSVVVTDAGHITATFDLTDASPGPWDVVVTNPDHGVGTCSGCFTVGASAPTVTMVDPTEGFQGSGGDMTVTGTNFAHGAEVSFSPDSGINVVDTSFVSNTELTATVIIDPDAQPGAYDVVVTNTDGQSGTCTGCFTVIVPPNNAVTTGGFGAGGGIWRLASLNGGGAGIDTLSFGRSTDTPLTGDWDGDFVQTIGVRRGNAWFLRNTNSGGPADITFTYGASSDKPLVGDWNGDGTWTPGVHRGNMWYLRNSNTSGPGQIVFAYGAASDTPLVGDWTGDGSFLPGVHRGNTWLLRTSNSGGPAEIAFAYGASSDVPFVGDWNGDGIWTPGVYRPSTHQWFLKNSLSGGSADVVFTAPALGTPVVGDWDGDNPS